MMKTLNELDLELLPRRKRGRLINSLSGFKSANVIGTTDGMGHHNLAIFSSVVHLGSDPALLGVVMRPPVDRTHGSHTYWNIRETGVFTVNHVHADWYERAHQTSARFPEDTGEFEAVGLQPIFRCGFEAPAVEESLVRMGLEKVDEYTIEQNGCRIVVGQIRWVEFPKDALASDGYLDIESLQTVAVSSLDGYHGTKKLKRLPYASPEQPNVQGLSNFMQGWED
ncbi:MAG: flavin reductase family protein [Flavobacteriales bacterium]|jgi:flavin reductase (DIM6/NTAB) family NADH-FMN oxidoreductase RutF